MNPVPSDAQWLVLLQVEDGEVFYCGEGVWRARGPVTTFPVTRIINRLIELGALECETEGELRVTAYGAMVLARRSVYDVLERQGRRKQS